MDARITAVMLQIVCCTIAVALLAGTAVATYTGGAHGIAALVASVALFFVVVVYERVEHVFELSNAAADARKASTEVRS